MLTILAALLEAHLLESVLAVELVVSAVGGVYQVLHVGPDQHLPQPVEVAVVLVLHLHHAPGVLSCSLVLVSNLDKLVAAHNGEGKIIVVIFVSLSHCFILQRELIDGDTVRLQLCHDLALELAQLRLVDGVRLGYDGDDVHLLIQLLHAHQVNTLQS